MPATAALSWKATAEVMRGLSALPPLGCDRRAGRRRSRRRPDARGARPSGRYLPSAAAIGVGFMLPFALTVAAVAGSLLAIGARRVFRGVDEQSIMAVGAGGMAGESIMGVLIAILMATGVPLSPRTLT